MHQVRLYLAFALAIALIAFGIAQVAPGMGALFVVLASTIWTAFSVARQRRHANRC